MLVKTHVGPAAATAHGVQRLGLYAAPIAGYVVLKVELIYADGGCFDNLHLGTAVLAAHHAGAWGVHQVARARGAGELALVGAG